MCTASSGPCSVLWRKQQTSPHDSLTFKWSVLHYRDKLCIPELLCQSRQDRGLMTTVRAWIETVLQISVLHGSVPMLKLRLPLEFPRFLDFPSQSMKILMPGNTANVRCYHLLFVIWRSFLAPLLEQLAHQCLVCLPHPDRATAECIWWCPRKKHHHSSRALHPGHCFVSQAAEKTNISGSSKTGRQKTVVSSHCYAVERLKNRNKGLCWFDKQQNFLTWEHPALNWCTGSLNEK